MFEHFLNYNRLNTSYEHCQQKLSEIVGNRMLAGVHNNVWNKIMYMYKIANFCKMSDLFDIENIIMPEMSKGVTKLITSIKALYNKRDKVDVKNYSHKNMVDLYVFMLNNLTKKIGLIQSTRNKKRIASRDTCTYSIIEENKNYYDELLSIMRSDKGKTLTEEELLTALGSD